MATLVQNHAQEGTLLRHDLLHGVPDHLPARNACVHYKDRTVGQGGQQGGVRPLRQGPLIEEYQVIALA